MDQINAQKARMEGDMNSAVALLIGRLHLQIAALEAQVQAQARELDMLRRSIGAAQDQASDRP